VVYYKKSFYIKSFAFSFFLNLLNTCREKRQSAKDNRQRAYWAFMQGTSEALFLLFA
jgi:hypothetical protein